MIILAITVGIVLLFLGFLTDYIDSHGHGDFIDGYWFGVAFSILFAIEVGIVSSILEKPTPTPMDVYQGKTTLEYKVVDGVKIDSVVVFNNNEK